MPFVWFHEPPDGICMTAALIRHRMYVQSFSSVVSTVGATPVVSVGVNSLQNFSYSKKNTYH